jgi:Pvc16 N-terminal domain
VATSDAVACVGETIKALLQGGLAPIVASSDVIISTPDDFKNFAPSNPSVTIFLYHVCINAEMRNTPGPPNASRAPALPLELRYLITPWTKRTFDAHRIIGLIAQLLNDRASLTFSDLQTTGVCAGVWLTDDTVQLLMESIPVEQHYDIWEPTEIPYKLSLAYLARVIGIDSNLPVGGPPVVNAAFQGVTP